jgi:hypothetical protein
VNQTIDEIFVQALLKLFLPRCFGEMAIHFKMNMYGHFLLYLKKSKSKLIRLSGKTHTHMFRAMICGSIDVPFIRRRATETGGLNGPAVPGLRKSTLFLYSDDER